MYTIIEAIELIQQTESLPILGIEKEDASGMCWNVKLGDERTMFKKLPEKSVYICNAPEGLPLIYYNALRPDIVSALYTLLKQHRILHDTRNIKGVFKQDRVIFYEGGYCITIYHE